MAAVLATAASAYQREEHYYTTSLALAVSRPGGHDPVAAMCAQLADEAPELNPVEAYRRIMRRPFAYASWSMRSRGADEPVGHMITVQQALHGLTGGSSEAAHKIAVTVLHARLAAAASAGPDDAAKADASCALGFALHFYGDSFAHRRIYNPKRMYPTGLGHLFDGVTPDLPLYSPGRVLLWRQYLGSFAGVLPGYDPGKLEGFLKLSEAARVHAHDANSYGRDALRQVEHEELSRLGIPPAPLERAPSTFHCQQLVDAYAAKHALKAAPGCERAWTLYRDEVEKAVDAYESGPDEERAPARGLRRPFYRGPLFDGGAR